MRERGGRGLPAASTSCSRRSRRCRPSRPSSPRRSHDPGAALRAHRLHGAVQHVGAARGLGQRRLHGAPGCRSGCRSSAAASTISACCGWRMPSRRSAPHSGPGLCERKDKRRFASSCAGSRIAFHSPGSSPGCVAGVRESAVEGFGRSSLHCFPGRMQRKRNATRDPARRLCREAAPTHLAEVSARAEIIRLTLNSYRTIHRSSHPEGRFRRRS